MRLASCLSVTAGALAAVLFAAPVVGSAQTPAPLRTLARPAEDVARDAARKPAQMVAFAGIRTGTKVGDLIPGGGYFTRIFARAVGPTGKVYALVPAALAARNPEAMASMQKIAAEPGYGNVTAVAWGASAPLPELLDVVWTAQNYHDIHNAPSPAAVAGLNKAVFAALKPGGTYIVLDHVAAAGSGARDTKTLHRIDPDLVKSEVTTAGFVFEGEDTSLRNPADPHTAVVFDPAIRGKTDQFVYKFRKPSH